MKNLEKTLSELDLKPSIPSFSSFELRMTSPGTIFQSNKGKPNYFSYFETLYDSFEATIDSMEDLTIQNEDLNKEAQFLIETAKQLFLYCGLATSIHIGNNYLEALPLLKILLKTVFTFPKEFIQKLKVKELFIYSSKEQAICNHDLLVVKEECFIFDASISEIEVIQKFYTLIFVYYVRIDSKILEKWSAFRTKYNLNYPANSVQVVYEDLEKVFYSLLGIKQSTIMKQKKKKLQKLLGKFCPESVSSRTFGSKNSPKASQEMRVSFGNSIVSTYYLTDEDERI